MNSPARQSRPAGTDASHPQGPRAPAIHALTAWTCLAVIVPSAIISGINCLGPPGDPWREAIPVLAGMQAAVLALLGAATIRSLSRGRAAAIEQARVASADLAAERAARATGLRDLAVIQGALSEHLIVLVADAAGNLTDVNSAYLRLCGRTRDELLGRPLRSLFAAADEAARSWDDLWRGVAAGPSWRGDVCDSGGSGDSRWLDCIVAPFLSPGGGVDKYICVCSEVTQRRRMEDALRESRERLDLATRVSGAGVWDWNLLTNRVTWNAQMFDLYGLPPTADMSVSYADWASAVDPDDLSAQEAVLRDTIARRGSSVREFRIHRAADGTMRYMKAAEATVVDDAGRVIRLVGLNHDITGERARERELCEALEQLEFQKYALDEHAIVAITDARGTIQYVNDKFCDLSKYSREELIGANHRIVNSGRHPKSFFTNMYATIGRGRTWRGEICNRAKDGGLYWVDTTIVPFRNAAGRIERYVAIRSEITQLKSAEAAVLQANAQLEIRNRELSDFTHVASHDLQEPLRKLVVFSQLLPQDLGGDLNETAGKDLHFICDAARRMQALVEGLLHLSRAGADAMKLETVALDDIVDGALHALALRIEESRAIVERDALPTVHGDSMLLTQLYQNLIGNALKYVRPGDQPRVRLTAERNNEEWTLGVRDAGLGIKPEYLETVFAPFKRLHRRDEYEGSGIGLSICRRAVERHGGCIWVESRPDVGSWFKFTLKATEESNACNTDLQDQPSSCSSKTILATRS